MAEVPNPFEWNAEWDEKNKENFELVKKLDDNREDADARKVSNYTFLKETTSILKQKIIIIRLTVPGHKCLTAGCFLKQNYPEYRLCERDMGGSYLL